MICASVGSGVLTLPSIFKNIGWVNGVVLVSMGGFGCWWSLYMLIQRSRHHNLLNYSQVTRKAGGRGLELLLQISILLYMYATCLACTIVITQLFVNIMNAFGISSDVTGEVYTGITWFKSIQAVISAILIGLLSLGRNMSSFKNLAILSVSSLVLTVFVVAIELPMFLVDYKEKYECLGITETCYSFQTLSATGVILFAFTNQCNLLPVYKELQNPVKYRLMKIIFRSILIVWVLYVVMGTCGYFSTLNNTPELVLTRDAPFTDWTYDWFMIVASVFVMSVMVCNIALNYMPFRNSLYFMATGREDFS